MDLCKGIWAYQQCFGCYEAALKRRNAFEQTCRYEHRIRPISRFSVKDLAHFFPILSNSLTTLYPLKKYPILRMFNALFKYKTYLRLSREVLPIYTFTRFVNAHDFSSREVQGELRPCASDRVRLRSYLSRVYRCRLSLRKSNA